MTLRELQSLIESSIKEQEDPEKCRDYSIYINIEIDEPKSSISINFHHIENIINIY